MPGGTLSTLVDKEATRKIIFLLFLENIQIFIFFDYFILLRRIFKIILCGLLLFYYYFDILFILSYFGFYLYFVILHLTV